MFKFSISGSTAMGQFVNFEQTPIPQGHLFAHPFPLDLRQSKYFSLDMAYGAISNLSTSVDDAFFKSFGV